MNAALYTVLTVLGVGLSVFGMAESNIAEYGKPWIMLRYLGRYKGRWRWDSSLSQIFIAIGAAVLGCGFVWALVLLS